MNINLEFVAADNPTQTFENTITQAANMLAAMFTDNITINLQIGFGEVNGQLLSNGSAAAGPDLNGGAVTESYTTVRNALQAGASPGDSTFDFLPSTSSINGQSNVVVYSAQEKALGQISGTDPVIDGIAGFATDIAQGRLLGVALHELAHAMGRVPGGTTPNVFAFDRFTSAGNRLFGNGQPPAPAAYMSLNGGLTKWADYGTSSDPSDTVNNINYGSGSSNLTPEDAFNEFYDGSTLQYLTPFDLQQLDLLGFHLKYDAPVVDTHDFNGGNSGDVLVQNPSTGQIAYANMQGGTFNGFVSVATTPGWNVVGEGQISGGVCSDIVIQNPNTGQIQYANMINGAFNNWVSIATTPGFNVAGVGDILDNHYDDVVVQNPNTGEVAYANMTGGSFHGFTSLFAVPGWKVDAAADVNYDGYADIVIQSQSTAQIAYANMQGGTFHGFVSIGSTPGFGVVGTGDITRLGGSDVVVENGSTGQIAYADMSDGTFHGFVSIGSTPGWNVVAVEDILGNGYDDIVIENQSTQQLAYANMTGGTFNGWVSIATVPGFTGHTQPGAMSTSPSPSPLDQAIASSAAAAPSLASIASNSMFPQLAGYMGPA